MLGYLGKHTQGKARVLAIFVAAIVLFPLFSAEQAAALSGGDFKAGSIIDDGSFYNGNAMSTGEIQNFLNAKVPSCQSGYTCLKSYRQDTQSRDASAYCNGYGGGNQSSAEIIRNVGDACGVSQKVLLVLLQKEQALVTDSTPDSTQYRSATGYGCPDSSACDSTYYGFFNQVYSAARQYKLYSKNPTSYSYRASRNNTILYNPESSCGNSQVFIQNQATAGLYIYTPYQPNQAALNNLYGSGDSCSSYGNRNFWRLYSDWFGLSQSEIYMRVISDNSSDPRQWVIYGNIKQHLPDAETIYAWGLQDTPLTTLSAGYIDSVATGPNLDRVFRLNEAGNYALYFADGGKRYRVPWADMLSAWNIGGRTVSSVPVGLYNTPKDTGDLNYAIKPQSSSTIYMMDGANGGGQTVIRPYQNADMFHAWEGDNATYTTIADSSGFFDTINDAIGGSITTPKISYSGSEYEVANGSKTHNTGTVGALYPGTAQPVSAMTARRIPTIGTSKYIVKSVNDSAVYLIDNGVKHHILWSSTLKAWGGSDVGITYVNDAFMATFTPGSDILGYLVDTGGKLYLMDDARINVPTGLDAAYRNSGSVFAASTNLGAALPLSPRSVTGYVIGAGTSPAYVLDNSGKKRHMEWADKVTAWGGYQAGLTVLSPYVVNDMATAASPSTYVSDGTSEYFLDDGKKWILPSNVKTLWGITGTPQVYSDGTLSRLPTAGTLSEKIRDTSGGYYYIRNGAANVSYDSNIGEIWGLDTSTVVTPAFIRNNFPQYMLTRFVRSSVPGDNRKFIIDRGVWYAISDTQFANVGGPGSPMMQLNPALAPTTITDWTAVVVKAGDGSYFVIDGGGKHYFDNTYIRDYWTNNRTITAPLVTNGFVNLLPTRGLIERAIKGSSGAIYAGEGGVKRHILYSSTYNQLYAPYKSVTDELLYAMPDGPTIP
ncbi:MAG TPA: hypothetical protein VK502_00770 [Candidatus Saccharimonadales bacterium]|nr:hypothetical protein [Candidatus Saccharimonadales bacterium]